jgi:hypothetical protein
MSKRTPILPEPREEIWLSPKNPRALAAIVLVVVLVIGLFLVVAVGAGNPPSTPIPTIVKITPQRTKTKTPVSVINTNPPVSTKSAKSTKMPTSTITLTPDLMKDCNASYKSRLKVGDKAYVSETPPLRNRLRSGPYVTNSIIGYIDPGEQVDIIKGPSCSNRWVWWKVKKANGEIGWTSEGDESNYWLVPLR